jgi:hypothetical protein
VTGKFRFPRFAMIANREKECIANGIVRFGFGTDGVERFGLCESRDWDGLLRSFLGETTPGTATRFTNETRAFFEDDGATL